jgi:hypothetical protein
MSPWLSSREERSLAVQSQGPGSAGIDLGAQLAVPGDRGDEFLGCGGDDRRDVGRDPRLGQPSGDLPPSCQVGGCEVVAVAAVDLDVDEPWCQHAPREFDRWRVRRTSPPRSNDPVSFGTYPPPTPERAGEQDLRSSDERHVPPFCDRRCGHARGPLLCRVALLRPLALTRPESCRRRFPAAHPHGFVSGRHRRGCPPARNERACPTRLSRGARRCSARMTSRSGSRCEC